MNGIQEHNKLYIDRINNVLKNQPDYLRGYVNYLSDTAITTKYAYMHHVINFKDKINKPVNELILDDFSGYISSIEYKDNGESTTSSYRIAVYSAIKKFCEYLYASKRIEINYMLYVKRPKSFENQKTIEKRNNGFLTEKEIDKYIQTVKLNNINPYRQVSDDWNLRDDIIIKIFILTGIRCSALRKLDINSVDLKRKTLIVTDKGDKVKICDLSDDLIEEINEWFSIRKNKIKDDDPALFISNRKKRMDQTSISNVVKKYSKLIKNKNITPHKLRATYGTQLYKATHDVYYVQECMGHSNPKTTELYIRDKEDIGKKSLNIMSKLINLD